MGTKLQELRDGCFAKAMDDEPMFVLLARDPGAPELVRQWANGRLQEVNAGKRPAADMAQIQEARECADRMEAWRSENDGAWRSGLFARAEELKGAVAEGMAAEPSLTRPEDAEADERQQRDWEESDSSDRAWIGRI